MGFVSLDREILLMSTTGNAITAGGNQAGWISGTIASLAASGVATVQFDLGPEWAHYPYVRLFFNWVSPSTGSSNTQVYGGDTAGALTRRLGFIDTNSVSTTFLTLSTSNGPQIADVRPMSRHITVSATNTDAVNAVGSTARIDLAAYPF